MVKLQTMPQVPNIPFLKDTLDWFLKWRRYFYSQFLTQPNSIDRL